MIQANEEYPSHADHSYLSTIFNEVDATMFRLADKRFSVDPVVEARYSRITSIVSSAYKRHGGIIERAFAAALRRAPHLRVWEDPVFRVSAAAERLADTDATAVGAALPYGGDDYVRTLQVDFLVFDDRGNRLGAYECKRGFGYHDSGKKRSMLRDLRCLQMLIKSYGEQRDLPVRNAEARIIFYYGQCSVGAPWALTREDLDEHFGAPVTEAVEQVNDYFKSRLGALLGLVDDRGEIASAGLATLPRPAPLSLEDLEDLV
jgi:hypothetical protein